tara:strand:- start:1457 stop:1852 length:396 start_codon:yes stop_codon:yes gene_type:complete
MNDPVLNLITSPDKLFNNNPSLLLVNPSDTIKENFNFHAKEFKSGVNLYLYENIEEELGWLLDIVQSVDHIVLDIDNTKNNHWIIGHLLGFGKTFYLTNTPNPVYNVINNNRIYELKQFMEGVKYFGIQQQ